MKILFSIIFLLALSATSYAGSSRPKIGFILATMQEERYQQDKKFFEKAVHDLGGDVVFVSCNNQEQLQASRVDDLLSQKVDALVIQAVNGDTASSFVKQAKQDGVPVVAYDRLIRNAPLDAFITEDSHTVGKLQAEAAVKFTHAKGNYVILMGEAGESGTLARTEGVLSVLNKYPDIKIVAQQTHKGWSPDLAMKTLENVLTRYKNNIQAVIANNSGMANGAVQAIEEQKLSGKIFVAGADADLSAIHNILKGKQQFDVMVSIEDQARHAAEAAMALVRKQNIKEDALTDNGLLKVKTLKSPVYAIDISQIESRIIKTGFHTRSEIYGN